MVSSALKSMHTLLWVIDIEFGINQWMGGTAIVLQPKTKNLQTFFLQFCSSMKLWTPHLLQSSSYAPFPRPFLMIKKKIRFECLCFLIAVLRFTLKFPSFEIPIFTIYAEIVGFHMYFDPPKSD